MSKQIIEYIKARLQNLREERDRHRPEVAEKIINQLGPQAMAAEMLSSSLAFKKGGIKELEMLLDELEKQGQN